MDGKSEETAFGTIQDALDNSDLTSSDTIKVKPGVYDKGGHTGDAFACRVYLNRKCPKIESTGGKDVTFIVGRKLGADEGGDAYGRGPGAMRCVCRGSNIEGDVTIRGFTLTGGATASTSVGQDSEYGGGAFDNGPKGSYAQPWGLLIVDCVISNCAAFKGGGSRCGTLIRTLITDCYAEDAGSAANGAQLYSSIAAYNHGSAALSTCNACNCTIVGNSCAAIGTCLLYNCVFDANDRIYDKSDNKTLSGSVYTARADGRFHLVAPAVGDYRLLAGTPALGIGKPSYADKINKLGNTYRHYDYYGKAVPSSGSCDAGAIQGDVTPAGGCLRFSGAVSIGGVMTKGDGTATVSWVYPTQYPTQYCVRAVLPESSHIFAIRRLGTSPEGYRFPGMDDMFWLMPPADPAVISTNEIVSASHAYWVDPDKGSNGGLGTKGSPFKTLHKAVSQMENHRGVATVVYAAAGDYNDDGGKPGNGGVIKGRICLVDGGYTVFIRGAGPGKSFVTGAADPTSGGFGDGAIRPVSAYNHMSAIQGFTLRGGWSRASGTYDGAGAIAGRAQDGYITQLLDCEISDCHGKDAIVYNCALTRCTFGGNASEGVLANTAPLFSTLIRADNAFCTTRSTLASSHLVNVTMLGSTAVQMFAGSCSVYGCVFENGGGIGSNLNAAGNVCWNVSGVSGKTGFAVGDPAFVGLGSGEYHVHTNSAACTAMDVPAADNYGAEYWKHATTDLDGKPLAFSSGRPVAGAFQTTVGEIDWYVDAVNGDDANTGFSPDEAKKTLKSVMEAGVSAGDTVHAAPGTYADGVMYRDPNVLMGSRVRVPDGATLVADEGAAVTVIRGADATTADVTYGCGSNAVRCAYLGLNAKIKGFTLADGRTCCHPGGKTNIDNLGGGVTASVTDKPESHVVEDCVITSCNGYRAGGANHVRLVRCRVLDCRGLDSEGQASGTSFCEHYATYVDGCKPNYAVMYPKSFVSSTAGVANEGMGGPYLNSGNTCAPIVNSIIAGRSQIACRTELTHTFCGVAPEKSWEGWKGEGTKVASALALDAFGRPVVGSCDAVDGGDFALYDAATCGATDAAGGQRVYNGQIDAGAYEADWRSNYAKSISSSGRFSVADASAGVKVGLSGVVMLVPGETLAARWCGLGEDGEFSVVVKVSGGGTLTVSYGDDVRTVVASGDVATLKFSGCADDRALTFAFSGADGTAEIRSAKHLIGMAIILK